MALRREDRPSFARAVWAEFVKLRGDGAHNPSAREYYVLTGWMDSGVPLPVILRAFGEFQGRPRVLTAMEAPVARAFRYWYDAMGGRP